MSLGWRLALVRIPRDRTVEGEGVDRGVERREEVEVAEEAEEAEEEVEEEVEEVRGDRSGRCAVVVKTRLLRWCETRRPTMEDDMANRRKRRGEENTAEN